MNQHRRIIRSRPGSRSWSFRLLPFLLLLTAALLLAACSSRGAAPAAANRDAALRQIATQYAQTGDLKQAQAALDKLGLANPGQLLLSLAEADLSAGHAREEINAEAALAEMLGARSQRVAAYLTPSPAPAQQQAALPTAAPTVLAATVAVPTAKPASPTPVPPTAEATATLGPSATPAPPTNSPTPEPQNPRVKADKNVNLRGGPGTAYGVVAQLRAGQEAAIIGRNASGDWWQVDVTGVKQAWVAGTVIKVLGAIDTVAVAQNIPPAPTAAPRPTAAPQPTKAPVVAGPDFRVIERRLWSVEETGGFHAGTSVNCGYRRELHVKVVDAAGNPLNGVTVKANLGGGEEVVTGHKGAPGDAEFVLGGGQEVSVIRDVDGRNITSDYVPGLSTTSADISRDDLKSAGYCTEDGTCDAFLKNWGCTGHHSWTVTFRRSY